MAKLKSTIFVRGDKVDEIYCICKLAMECIVHSNYTLLKDCKALTRVSENDIKRVLAEYNPNELPVMPLDLYFKETAYIYSRAERITNRSSCNVSRRGH